MSTASLESKWGSLSDSELDEWLLINDEINDREVNSPLSELTICGAAEQVLQDELKRNENEYCLEDFPLFDEVQSIAPFEEIKPPMEKKVQDFPLNLNQGQIFLCDSPTSHEIQNHPSPPRDLPHWPYEDAATFILLNDNELYFHSQPFINPSVPSETQCLKSHQYYEDQNYLGNPVKEDSPASLEVKSSLVRFSEVSDVKNEITAVDDILNNSAMELDQWDSETSRSEVISIATSEASPKMRDDENYDPEWRPKLKSPKPRKGQRTKSASYWRAGNRDDKMLRKKEQNKNAATRYRQKKKAEVCEILKKEEELKEKKAELEEKALDIQNEIKCLKGLMRDLFKAKGLIN